VSHFRTKQRLRSSARIVLAVLLAFALLSFALTTPLFPRSLLSFLLVLFVVGIFLWIARRKSLHEAIKVGFILSALILLYVEWSSDLSGMELQRQAALGINILKGTGWRGFLPVWQEVQALREEAQHSQEVHEKRRVEAVLSLAYRSARNGWSILGVNHPIGFPYSIDLILSRNGKPPGHKATPTITYIKIAGVSDLQAAIAWIRAVIQYVQEASTDDDDTVERYIHYLFRTRQKWNSIVERLPEFLAVIRDFPHPITLAFVDEDGNERILCFRCNNDRGLEQVEEMICEQVALCADYAQFAEGLLR